MPAIQSNLTTITYPLPLIAELFAVTMFLSMFHMDAETMGEFDFGDPTQTEKIARMMYQQPGMKRVLLQTMPQLMYKGLLDI